MNIFTSERKLQDSQVKKLPFTYHFFFFLQVGNILFFDTVSLQRLYEASAPESVR